MIQIDKKEIEKIDALTNHARKIYEAAKYYIAQGIFVVPIRKMDRMLPSSADGGINYQSASRKPEVIEKWFGKKGKYKGYNIGIACGRRGGVFAVDIDIKKGKGGDVALKQLEEKHGEALTGPIQITPSGGKHYLFHWMPNGRCSSESIGRGIDTRGGDESSCKGHIVAWPSIVEDPEGGPPLSYRWLEGGEVVHTPAWISDALGEPWRQQKDGGKKKAKKGGRGNEGIKEDDVEREYAVVEIGRMVKHIDPDELTYDEWLWVGQAIHSQHPDDAGLELWDIWSKEGTRYEPNECHLRWFKFSEDGPVRIGSLIHLAQRGGYDPRTHGKEVATKKEDFESLVIEFNKTYAVTLIGGSVKILMEKKHDPLDPIADRFALLDVGAFKVLHANDVMFVEDAKGNPKPINRADLWLGDENRRTFPNGLKFRPGGSKNLDGAYNMWQPWPYEAVESDWGLFKEHIEKVICKNEKHLIEWLFDWMADIIQDPAHPKGCALILAGIEGTGKGMLFSILGKLLGTHYKYVNDEEHLIGKFNAHLQDALLIFADEVTYGGSRKVAGKLKSIVSESIQFTERKGVDVTRDRSYARLGIASNEDWFIPAGPHSRRWFILEVSSKKANDEAYFGNLKAQMKNGGYEGLFYFLKNREIKSNLRFAPVTEKLIQQRTILSAQNSVIEWWISCVEAEEVGNAMVIGEWKAEADNIKWPEGPIKAAEFFRTYEEWVLERKGKRITAPVFAIEMESMGVFKTREYQNDGSRPVVFTIKNIESTIKTLEKSTGVKINDTSKESAHDS